MHVTVYNDLQPILVVALKVLSEFMPRDTVEKCMILFVYFAFNAPLFDEITSFINSTTESDTFSCAFNRFQALQQRLSYYVTQESQKSLDKEDARLRQARLSLIDAPNPEMETFLKTFDSLYAGFYQKLLPIWNRLFTEIKVITMFIEKKQQSALLTQIPFYGAFLKTLPEHGTHMAWSLETRHEYILFRLKDQILFNQSAPVLDAISVVYPQMELFFYFYFPVLECLSERLFPKTKVFSASHEKLCILFGHFITYTNYFVSRSGIVSDAVHTQIMELHLEPFVEMQRVIANRIIDPNSFVILDVPFANIKEDAVRYIMNPQRTFFQPGKLLLSCSQEASSLNPYIFARLIFIFVAFSKQMNTLVPPLHPLFSSSREFELFFKFVTAVNREPNIIDLVLARLHQSIHLCLDMAEFPLFKKFLWQIVPSQKLKSHPFFVSFIPLFHCILSNDNNMKAVLEIDDLKVVAQCLRYLHSFHSLYIASQTIDMDTLKPVVKNILNDECNLNNKS